MDIIWEELKRNNINIDKDMLSFYISKCLDEQREMYNSLNAQISPMCFQPVFEEMSVNNFARIIAYLAFVCWLSDSCDEETIQEAVRRTIEAFRLIDLEKYKVKTSRFNWLTQLFYHAVVMYVERCYGQLFIGLERVSLNESLRKETMAQVSADFAWSMF